MNHMHGIHPFQTVQLGSSFKSQHAGFFKPGKPLHLWFLHSSPTRALSSRVGLVDSQTAVPLPMLDKCGFCCKAMRWERLRERCTERR